MSKHPKKQISGLIDLRAVKGHGFGKRLVNCLIEANNVVQMHAFRLRIIAP